MSKSRGRKPIKPYTKGWNRCRFDDRLLEDSFDAGYDVEVAVVRVDFR